MHKTSSLWMLTASALLLIAVVAADEHYAEAAAVRTSAASAVNALSAKSTAHSSASPTTTPLYRVTRVVDGDTIRVAMNGRNTTVRLIGVNSPESVDPRKPVECFGKEAASHAKSLMAGQRVRLELDASQGERDKYNRLLAYVVLADGTSINHRMIADGFAYEYTYRTPYKLQADFKEAQREAQIGKRGLWADGACAKAGAVPVTSATNAKPTDSTSPASSNNSYICTRNTYDCSNFSTQAEAQKAFQACQPGDIHRLDADRDGLACESLPK